MSMIDDSKLVDQLVRSDVVSEKDLRHGLNLAKERGKSLYETLIAAELVDERTLIKSVGKLLNIPPVWLGERTPDAQVTERIPRSLAVRNNVLPLKTESGADQEQLVLAMADPLDVLAMDEIASHAGVSVRPVLAGLGDLARALERVYGADELDPSEDTSSLDALEQAAAGEGESGAGGFGADDSSFGELDSSEIDGEPGGLNDDSWASFFDDAEDVDYTEDSAVISRDMQDRAISSILDAVDSEVDDDITENSDAEDEDSLKSLDEPLSRSQITGGIEPDLGDWELDGALDGDKSKDYAKIGHLFVYSPEKAPDQSSEAEVVEDSDASDADTSDTGEEKEDEEKEDEEKEDEEKEPELKDDELKNDKPAGPGLGNEPSAAIINPLKKLKSTSDPTDDARPEPSEPEPLEQDIAESSAEADSDPEKSVAKRSPQPTFVARLAELADLDKESLRLIEDASTEDLTYALILALAHAKVIDARDLIEYIGK
jgi:hypothetical protein